MPRFRSRSKSNKDSNHDAVKQVFIDAGYHTQDVHMINCGYDFFAWKDYGLCFQIEVKDDLLPPSKTKLTSSEIDASKLYPTWRRIGSVKQAINFVQNKYEN